jgi:hypothetical protein
MQVEVDQDIGVSAKTVGELRNVTSWPENLAITTPPDHSPEGTIKVTKASKPTFTHDARCAGPSVPDLTRIAAAPSDRLLVSLHRAVVSRLPRT